MIKKNKILLIMILILIIFNFILPQFCYAENLGLGDFSAYKGSATASQTIVDRTGKILSYIQTVGTAISVVILVIIGMKYMMASLEERAEYKKTLIPYLIGAIILFTGTLLPGIIYTLSINIF